MLEKLEEHLNVLWASKIIEYNFDVLSNRIILKLTTVDNGEINNYKLKFNKVSLLYFINNISELRMNIYAPEKDDYLELTSINILQDVELLIESLQDDWVNQYKGKANVCIEIWNKLVLIEASSIELNNKTYSLKTMK